MHGSEGDSCHNEDHGEHHKGHKYLSYVADEAGKLTDKECTADNHISAEIDNGNDAGIHNYLHCGLTQNNELFGIYLSGSYIVSGSYELLALKPFSYECLYNSDTDKVFLYLGVEGVILFKHFLKSGECLCCDKSHCNAQNGDSDQEHNCQLCIEGDRHYKCDDKHERRTYRHSDYHHKGVLNVCNVSGKSCYQRSCGELIHVCKGKILNLVKKLLSYILSKAHACLCGKLSAQCAAAKGEYCHGDHDKSHFYCERHIAVGNSHVHYLCHYQWYKNFHQYLAYHYHRRENGIFFVLAHTGEKLFQHLLTTPL